jgi:hypothetical protein
LGLWISCTLTNKKKTKTKNSLTKENEKKKKEMNIHLLWWLLESLLLQAPSSSLQNRRQEGSTNQYNATRQRGSKAQSSKATKQQMGGV